MLNREIVFSRAGAGKSNKDIFTLQTDLTLTRITFGLIANPAYDSAGADWSSDGMWLVCDSTRDKISVKNSDIYKVELANLNNIQRMTTTTQTTEDASWSRANGDIVYGSQGSDPDNPINIWEMDTNGDNEAIFISSSVEDLHPRWSLDGSKIAFSREAANNVLKICIYDISTSQVSSITDGHRDWAPSFSPDGSKIVFSRMKLPFVDTTRELYTVEVGGSNLSQLTSSGVGVTNDSPCWSPDNSKIVFESNRNGNNSEIYEMPSGGGTIEAITNDSLFDHFAPVYKP